MENKLVIQAHELKGISTSNIGKKDPKKPAFQSKKTKWRKIGTFFRMYALGTLRSRRSSVESSCAMPLVSRDANEVRASPVTYIEHPFEDKVGREGIPPLKSLLKEFVASTSVS